MTTFPIMEVKENKLISVEGNQSYFYELIPPDGEQLDSLERENFFRGIRSSLNTLDESSYFKFYRLGERNFLETNLPEKPHLSGVEILPCSEHLREFFGDIEIFSDVGIYDDYLLFNGKYLKILSIKGFSEEPLDESFLPEEDYALFVHRVSPEMSFKKLDGIRSSHMSSFLKDRRDVKSEGAYAQAKALMESLGRGEESLFRIELFFILRSDSLEDLGKKVRALQMKMSAKGVKLFLEGNAPLKGRTGIVPIFNELIPGVRPRLSWRSHLTQSGHLLYLLPLKRSFLMKEGIAFYGQDSETLYFNPFLSSLKNKNMLVTGMSGSGKSVFVNKLIFELAPHHPVVILDKGGSFKRLTLYHGGKVLEKGFNPMQFRCPFYLREVILSVADGERFDKLERGRLLSHIRQHLPASSSFDGLLRELENDFPSISLYFEDIKEFLVKDILKESPILYVDVENYPSNILSPLILFILQYFKNLNHPEKVLVFDECWSFLKKHSSYVDECFRTFRKSGSFPIAISQGMGDFELKSIANNSYFKVFFPQDLSSKELSPFDREKIKGLHFEKGAFSDCYLRSDDNRYRKTLRLYLSPLEWELFQTEGDNSLELFLEKFGHFFETSRDAINSFTRMKYEDIAFFNDLTSKSKHSLSA